MIEISLHSPDNGIFQKDIAANQDLSVKYLDHIISSLKAARLIANVKGRKSGYILTRKPSEINILDIHNAFEPGICIIDCLEKHVKCARESVCQTQRIWKELNDILINYFKSVTLDDLIQKEINT